MVNIKANVISFPDEFGNKVFDHYYISQGKRGIDSHPERIKLAYIQKALENMQYVDFIDLPSGSEEQFMQELLIVVDDIEYSKTFELIKPLEKENIYELRINLSDFNWRFRATFFPYEYNSNQFYCFVFPFEKKKQVKVNLTDIFRDKTYTVYNNLLNNPDSYSNYFE